MRIYSLSNEILWYVPQRPPKATGGLFFQHTGQEHDAWGPKAVGDGNIVKGPNPPGHGVEKPYDYVKGTVDNEYTEAGTVEWNIPWEYSIGSVERKEFTRLLHKNVYDGEGKMTVSKGGVSTTQTTP